MKQVCILPMYHIITKPGIDTLLCYQKNSDSIMECLGKYDPVYESETKCEFDVNLINDSIIYIDMLAFGERGGSVQYRLAEVLSNPITETTRGNHISSVIINTPHAIQCVLLEFPEDLCKMLKMCPISRLIRFTDTQSSSEQMLAKGIDPEAKNWICRVKMEIPDWAYSKLMSAIQNSSPVLVKCYPHLFQTELKPNL